MKVLTIPKLPTGIKTGTLIVDEADVMHEVRGVSRHGRMWRVVLTVARTRGAV